MFINSGLSARSPFANATNIGNQASDKKTSVMQVGAATQQKRDKLELSSDGKESQTSGVVESLQEQKESIKEQKEEYIAGLADSGMQFDSGDPQLQNFDAQIEKLDSQIAELQTIATLAVTNDDIINAAESKEAELEGDMLQSQLAQLTADEDGASGSMASVPPAKPDQSDIDGDMDKISQYLKERSNVAEMKMTAQSESTPDEYASATAVGATIA